MMNLKKILAVGTIVSIIGVTGVTAFASEYKTRADIVSDLTGKSVESVIEEKQSKGVSYGKIADEAGKLQEFKTAVMELNEEKIKAMVEDGTITQEKADEALEAIKNQQAQCDGTGSKKLGQSLGLRLGGNNGNANGQRQGNRNGLGNGLNKENGMRRNANPNGSCVK